MLFFATAELGTNGNNVGTAEGWSTPVTTGGPMTYDSTTAGAVAFGSNAYKYAVGGTLNPIYVEKTLGATYTRVYGRLYYYATVGNPGSTLRLVRLMNGSTILCTVAIASGTARIAIRNAADTSVVEGATGGGAIAASTLYRIDFDLTVGGGATAGAGTVRLFQGTSATQLDSATISGVDFGSVGADRVRFGNNGSNFTINQSFWLDAINVNDTGVPGVGPDSSGPTDPAQNAHFSPVIGDEFALRFDIQETGGAAITDGFHLYANKNGVSGYQRVTTSSAGLRILSTSSRFTDDAATTDLLTGGSGTFVAGKGDKDGATGTVALGAGGNTEVEFALTIDATGVTAGDYWDVRVYKDDGSVLDSYTVTPRVTAAAPASTTPSIGLSPTSLTFTASEGGANPTNKNLNLSNVGGGTLSFTVSDNASWLSVSPTSGTAPQTLVVSAATGSLTNAGSPYTGTITISATGADNTPQTVNVTFTVNPVASFPVDVGGTYGETNNHVAPILAPNGALYIVNEAQNVPPTPAMRKSTDGGVTWTEMDPRTTGKEDMESIHMELVGTDIIVAWQRSGYYGYFNVFDTTTDTWTNTAEAWRAESSTAGTDQFLSLARRSDGTYFIVFEGNATQAAYKFRDAGGTWGSETILDSEASKDFSSAWVKKSAQGDGIHIVYFCLTDGILYHRFLSSGNVLSARTSIATGLSTGSGATSNRKPLPNHPLLIWDNAGTDNLYVAYRKSDGLLYGKTLTGNGGAPTVGSEEAISSTYVGQDPDGLISYQTVGAITRDSATGEIYALWAAGNDAAGNYSNPVVAANNNMRMRVRASGGTWGSITTPHITEPIGAIAASIQTISSVKQLCVFYDEYTAVDPGQSKYTRFLTSSTVAVGKDLAVPWTIRAAVGANAALPWTIRTKALKDLATPWTIRTTALKDLATPWTIRAAVGANAALPWTIRGLATKDLATPWTIRTTAAKDLATPWTIRTTALKDLATPWTIRAAAGANSVLPWTIRAAVGANAVLPWTIRTTAAKDAVLPWTIRTMAAKDAVLPWTIRATAGKFLDTPWTIRTMASKDLATPWTIRTMAAKDLATPWTIRALAGANLTLQWEIESNTETFTVYAPLPYNWSTPGGFVVAGRDLETPWTIRSTAGRDLATPWTIRTLAVEDLALPWTIRAAVGKDLATPWTVRTLAAEDLALPWTIRVPVGQDLATPWTIRAVVPKDLELQWAVRALAARELELRWVLGDASVAAAVALPTGAVIVAWNASALIAPYASTAEIAEYLAQAAVVANISSVSVTPNANSALISPHSTDAEVS